MTDLPPDWLPAILHGGDYNPEQWPEPIWDEDVRLMREARVNVATLPVFGWVALQPAEDRFTFDWLDRVLDKLSSSGIRACLATPTAAMPAWMAQKYPDALRTDADGHKYHHGNRQNHCPNSPNLRRLSANIAQKMAERYGQHPALLLWHVSNEYARHCYCDLCAAAFRTWLQQRYGSLDELNRRWYTAFWGHTFTDWSQVEPPYKYGELSMQALRVDYDRFQNDSILALYRLEADALRAVTPDVPITTNLMGSFKPLNYHTWAPHMDVVSWDNYPRRRAAAADIAFQHSIMRGLKPDRTWLLMEQTPSQQNWQQYNSLKPPGVMRLWSLQAVAHGSDAVMYFQWRRSRGATEKFHGAVVEHEGTSKPRVFQEVAALGRELESLGQRTLGGLVQADVAILFDWENWWALEYSSGPSVDLKYQPQVAAFFAALHAQNITADVVSPDADLSKYKLVIAPVLYMVRPGVADRLKAYTKAGGTFVTTFFSGIVDENDLAFLGGYPGPLRDLVGVWAEEIDVLAPTPEESNRVVFTKPFGHARGEYRCNLLCDRIHPDPVSGGEGAEVLATYADDFYAGEPALTRNRYGQGHAYYLATALEPAGLQAVLKEIASAAGVEPVLPQPTEGIEALVRATPTGERQLYLLNHAKEPRTAKLPKGHYTDLLTNQRHTGTLKLDKYGVAILVRAD